MRDVRPSVMTRETRSRMKVWAVLIATSTLTLVGCGGEDGADAGGQAVEGASCSLVIEFDGRPYGVGEDLDERRGRKLGEGTMADCGDADGPRDAPYTIYTARGIDPAKVIVAVSIFGDVATLGVLVDEDQ